MWQQCLAIQRDLILGVQTFILIPSLPLGTSLGPGLFIASRSLFQPLQSSSQGRGQDRPGQSQQCLICLCFSPIKCWHTSLAGLFLIFRCHGFSSFLCLHECFSHYTNINSLKAKIKINFVGKKYHMCYNKQVVNKCLALCKNGCPLCIIQPIMHMDRIHTKKSPSIVLLFIGKKEENLPFLKKTTLF